MMQHSVFRLFWTFSVPGVVSARQTGPRWLRITLSEKQRTFIHTLPTVNYKQGYRTPNTRSPHTDKVKSDKQLEFCYFRGLKTIVVRDTQWLFSVKYLFREEK